uniref:Uncharacterized protein n=1 Tax=Hucho hucho TaxID=62062 RepID=A0A4W5P3I4_9TELE
MVQVKMSKSSADPLSGVGTGSQTHSFQLPRKLPKRKSRFKRSDGSTSSDTTSSFIKRQVNTSYEAAPIQLDLVLLLITETEAERERSWGERREPLKAKCLFKEQSD